MAANQSMGRISREASGALASQFKFVKETNTGLALAGNGEFPDGVGCESAAAAGDAVAVDVLGTVKLVAAGNIARGGFISSNATGQAVTSVTQGHVRCAKALEPAVNGQVFEALLGYYGLVP